MRLKCVLFSASLFMMACESNEDSALAAEVDGLARQVMELQEQVAVCTALTEGQDSVTLVDVVAQQQAQIDEQAAVLQETQTTLIEVVEQLDSVSNLLNAVDTKVAAVQRQSIDTPMIWSVGDSAFSRYKTLDDALEAMRAVTIHPDASLLIQVSPGLYTHTETLSLNHPDGARITIEGNPEDPGTVVLAFKGDLTHSVMLSDGHQLDGFRGFTLRGDGASTRHGLAVEWGAVGFMGSLVVEDFAAHGILVGHNATLSLDEESVIVRDNGGYGVKAYYGALIKARGLVSESNGYSGVIANLGALAVVPNGQFDNNAHSGVLAHYQSLAVATGAKSRYNDKYGFYAYGNSMLYAPADGSYETNATGNGLDGFFSHSSVVRGNGARIHNNDGYGSRISYQGYLDIREFTGNGGASGVSWTGGHTDINATILR